ncbi:MAG: hypothetical protein HS111_32570 [Kofleriaceae bacterium]|nr:hypothetical protein [Kofleriaceae bacterium]MCL4223365.1 hypothetical protein [Myxococcales bacterium]
MTRSPLGACVGALALATLLVAACGRERGRPPTAAAQACRAAMEAAGKAGHLSPGLREALACEELYADRACAAAWAALGRSAAAVDDALAAIEGACRAACIRVSGGAPLRGCVDPIDRFGDGSRLGRVVELDRALLEHLGLTPSLAEGLAMRALVLGAGSAVTSIDVPPPAGGAGGPGPGAAAGAELIIEIDRDELRVGGEVVHVDDLTGTVSRLRHLRGVTRAQVLSAADVPYARVVDVLDAVRASGIDEVSFSTRP